MISKDNRINLRYSFIGLFLVATCGLGLMLLTSHYYLVEKVLKDSIYQSQQATLDQKLELIDNWFAERHKELINLGDNPVVYNQNKASMTKLFREFTRNNPEYERLAFINLQGRIEANSQWKNGIDLHDKDFFKAGLEGQYFNSEVMLSSLTDKPMMIFTEPIKANEKVIGVLVGVINLPRLNEIMQSLNSQTKHDTYLCNLQGFLVTQPIQRIANQPFQTLKTQLKSEGIKLALAGKLTKGEFKNFAGQPVLGTYRVLPKYKWVMIAETSSDQVAQTIQLNQKAILSTTLAVIILGLIPIGIFFSYLITNPVKKLTVMVNNVARGQWNQRVKVWWSFQEIATLAEAINHMAEIIEKNEEEIQANHEELVEKNRLLEQLAITDHLTQVYNRRYILGRMPTELAHAHRYHEQITTIMIDLDYFKKVNDTFGHNVGDQALLGVVEVIKQTIRKADILGRWGGEEFILICPNTSLQAAVALAERIRTKVEEVEFTTPEGVRIYLSLSMGVSAFQHLYPTFEQDIEDMIIRADKALYKAKNTGRNRVEIDDSKGIN